MTVDKFGRYSHTGNKCNLNEEVINLVQNFINIMQQIPMLQHHLPGINLSKPEQFKAMTDPHIFDEYYKYELSTKNPWWFKVWFENKYVYKNKQ